MGENKALKVSEDIDEVIKVTAIPTKEFFISMLIRDITLKDAIGDLIDNSVDGAKLKNKKKKTLNNYYIHINANENRFEITDNCGGIERNVAKNYAFQFGRPREFKLDNHSIGLFGIGMKRAFFKIGNQIVVQSKTKLSEFSMQIDVNEWRKELDNWNFKFDKQTSIPKDIINGGTKISITDLSDDAEESFKDTSKFFADLKKEISREHYFQINNGLEIKINSSIVKAPTLSIISNKDFKPAYWFHKFENGLKVTALAGISDKEGSDGGWYLFCNDRLVTGPDTSADTGWTGSKGGGVAEYHDQFHRFRGYVFFTCSDATKLPWNTTKTGMDLDSVKYQSVRLQMIQMMRPVMTFMNLLKKEKEKNTPKNEQVLNNMLMKIEPLQIEDILKDKRKYSDTFVYPHEIKRKKNHTDIRISYYKPKKIVDQVKDYYNSKKSTEIGEKTFDYFFDKEIGL